MLSSKVKASVIVLALLFTACASAPSKQSQQALTLQVLQRLDEFQNLVIDLYRDKQISSEHAVLYSKFVVSATRSIRTVPDGWQTTVKASWVEMKAFIPINQMELKVQVAASVLDTLLMGLK